jgi:hypothetical protein
MKPSNRSVVSSSLGVALCLCSGTAASQPLRVIRGTVFDTRDIPVPLVNVTVTGGPKAVSDDSGHFRLEISHRNRVVFDLRRLGYTPSRFSLAAGGDTAITVLLLPSAQQLAGVDVKETSKSAPTIAGFEDRMRARQKAAGAGYFVTAAEIEAKSPTRATQAVENVPGITVRRTALDKYGIYGRAVGTGGDCLATVWVDGVQIAGGSQPVYDRVSRRAAASPEMTEVDAYLLPGEIAGVEVYARGIMAPPQFLPPGDPNATRCAIVAFWTKHAR